jgi:LysM repeat protein
VAILISMTTANADAPRQAAPTGASTTTVDGRGAGVPRTSVADLKTDHASPRGCPFLVAESGGWRLGLPSREHRCGAFSPPASLAPEKQARLCLTPKHTGCATYLASQSARTERIGTAPVRRATRWGLARTTSVIEDPGGIRARLHGAVLDRRRWPAIPALILITTLLVLALSGLRGGLPAAAVATATPGQATHAVPTLPATMQPDAASPIASVAASSTMPSSAPASAAAATPAASTRPAASFRTYKVRSGDTLGAIASRYGTTVSALVALNHLSDAGRLRIGQVLLIP